MAVILSSREKKQWEEIKTLAQNNDCLCLDDADAIRMKRVLDLLQEQGYIKNLDVDGTNMFLVLGNLHDFDDWIDDEEKKQVSMEWEAKRKFDEETRRMVASSIVNGQPSVNGIRILDAAAEEVLTILLNLYDGNDLRLVKGRNADFPAAYRTSLRQEFDKLSMYGMITSIATYIGGWSATLLPQALTYFSDKDTAQSKSTSFVQTANNSSRKKYDVFISHANKDKLSYVNDLYSVLSDLGIEIFYDSKVLSWGDKWKDVILNGTEQSEFAIIVISENFFGREWTETELNTFLEQENTSGQKIVLPLLYNVTIDQLKAKYPALKEIQAISTSDYTKEQIAILFAQELIKRYK